MANTPWEQQVQSHPVHQALGDLIGATRQLDGVPDSHRDVVAHLQEVLSHAIVILSAADPMLLSLNLLNGLHNTVTPIAEPVTAFASSPQTAYLDQAVNYSAGLLSALAAIPHAPTDKLSTAAAAKTRELRAIATEGLREFRGEMKFARQEVEQLQAALDSAKHATDVEVASARSQVEVLSQTIEQQTARLDSALNDFNTRTTAALSDLQTTFSAAEETRRSEALTAQQEALEGFKAEQTAASDAFKKSAKRTIEELEALKEQAAQLVGVVTGTATAGHFKIVADGERRTANIWRTVAVTFAGAVVAVGIWIVATHADASSFAWGDFAAKAFLSLPLGALAFYAGNQSASHRQMERRARQTQLQLAALEPFVQPLDAEERAKIRAALAEHLFGPAEDVPVPDGSALSPSAIAKALLAEVTSQGPKK